MKKREATRNNINRYLKQYAPARIVDFRKLKGLSKDEKEQILNDNISFINNILEKINAENERLLKLKRKQKRDEKKKTDNIKKFVKENEAEILNLKNEGQTLILDFGRIKPDDINEYFVAVLNRLKNIIDFQTDNIIQMRINGVYYVLNQKAINNLIKYAGGVVDEFNLSSGYTETILRYLKIGREVEFLSRKKTNKNRRQAGAFFKYYINANMNLERYQITDGRNNVKENNINNDNCLYYALKLLGLPDDKLRTVKNYVLNGQIAICKLKDLCENAGFRIKLITERKTKTQKDKRTSMIYGTTGEIYNICCLLSHYFIYDDKTDYTSYFINNYHEVKNENRANHIYTKTGNNYKKDSKRTLNSFDLITELLENKDKLLIEITKSNLNRYDEVNVNYRLKDNIFDSLDYDTNYNSKPVSKDKPEIEEDQNEADIIDEELEITDNKNDELIFFDFETYKDKENNNIHIPYACVKTYINGIKERFTGLNCGEQLLRSLKKDCILIAHNAKYDIRFIIKNFINCREITNGGAFISFKGDIYNENNKKIKVEIKDSFKLIPHKLADFAKMFFTEDEQKHIKKEIMNYDYYSLETLTKQHNPLNEIIKDMSDEDKTGFINNCKIWGCIDDKNNVDIIEYSLRYCEIDCEILRKGYLTFKMWCLKDFNIDINNVLTVPSIANIYLDNQGCYKNCYKFSGLPREFIQNSIVGGRTMSCNNQQINTLLNPIQKIINDMDAVSLYPSAMSRIEGFIQGEPIELNEDQLNYEIIKNYDFYFVEIEILKVGINRNFPLMSYMTDKGTRDFSNNMINKNMFVNKIDLEDLIQFQKVEFKILRGYYFNQGFNNKIVETIKYLFNKRKELKDNDNKSELIYKLLMNSSYGKLIQKPPEIKIKFFNNQEELNIYLSRHHNIIINYIQYTEGKYRVEVSQETGNFYNQSHQGSYILSMSKRIMNELICLAEDNNLNIYYQDTDSIHIEDKDIKILQKLYENKYNRVLVGKNLCQFHSDFELKIKNKKLNNVISTGLIVLGKKSYIDVLEGEDDEGNKHSGFHIRLKGINKEAINYLLETEKDKYKDELDIYKALYKGDKIKFDLTAGGKKPCFEFNKSYSVATKTTFIRELSFKK